MDATCFEHEAELLSIIRNEFTERSAFYQAAHALGLVSGNKKIVILAQACPACETALPGKLISAPYTVTAARQSDLVIILAELQDLDRVADLVSSDTGYGRIGISEPFEKPEFLSVAYRAALDAIRLGPPGQKICSPPIEAEESPDVLSALIAFNHNVISALETGRFEAIPGIVEQYFSGIAPDEPDRAFNACLYSIHHVMDHFGIDPFSQVKLKYRFDLFGGSDRETLNAIKATFMHNMVRIVDYIRQMEGNPADFIIRRFREIVDNRFYQQDLTLLTISEDLHISYGYLSKLIRQKLGTCFTEYLTAVRMANARKLLHDGSMRVFEVADAVGYSSSKYFITIFRKYYGMSPSEFRKRNASSTH